MKILFFYAVIVCSCIGVPPLVAQEAKQSEQTAVKKIERHEEPAVVRMKGEGDLAVEKSRPDDLGAPEDSQAGKQQKAREISPTANLANKALAAAWRNYDSGNFPLALQQFEKASNSRDAEIHLQAQLGLAYTFLKLDKPESAVMHFRYLVDNSFRPEETTPRLIELLVIRQDFQLARTYLAHAPQELHESLQKKIKEAQSIASQRSSERRPVDTSETTKMKTGHKQSERRERSRRAWQCYNGADYQCAVDHFTWLRKHDPENEKYLLGLCYVYRELGKSKEALKQLDDWPNPSPSPEIKSLQNQLLWDVGNNAYERGSYQEAIEAFERMRELNPDNQEIDNLQAWSYYKAGDPDAALPLFIKDFKQTKSTETVSVILQIYERLDMRGEKAGFLAFLREENDPQLRKIVADHLYNNGFPLSAAQTYQGSDACYQGLDIPWLEAYTVFRHKNGDPGFSQYDQLLFPMARMHLPLPEGRELSVGFRVWRLDAGVAPAQPLAGKHYLLLNGGAEENALGGSLWAADPELTFTKEGHPAFTMRLGSTPLGGPVPGMFAFTARFHDQEKWHVDVHQCSVEDSLLSQVGQEDPYSDTVWGRVLKSGIFAGATYPFSKSDWLSISMGYDYYWGRNVIDNWQGAANFALGRTMRKELVYDGDLSLGIYLATEHFERNNDFFTFGHGGYFSPDIFFIFGPFARFTTKECASFWLDLQGSLGYMYFETEDAAKYHLADNDAASLNSAARTDLLSGSYQGETKSGVALDLKGQVLRRIGRYFEFGGFLGLNVSPRYNEWQAGLALHYSFGRRSGLFLTTELPWLPLCR